jgi:hypothetical protein
MRKGRRPYTCRKGHSTAQHGSAQHNAMRQQQGAKCVACTSPKPDHARLLQAACGDCLCACQALTVGLPSSQEVMDFNRVNHCSLGTCRCCRGDVFPDNDVFPYNNPQNTHLDISVLTHRPSQGAVPGPLRQLQHSSSTWLQTRHDPDHCARAVALQQVPGTATASRRCCRAAVGSVSTQQDGDGRDHG